jgi:hypothetical protein
MRKLAKRLKFGVLVIALIPVAVLVGVILEPCEVDSSTIVAIQLPFLAVQLFGLFMLIRYRWEIF